MPALPPKPDRRARGPRLRTLSLAVLLGFVAAALAAPAAAHAAATWTWPVEGELVTHYRYGGDPFAAGQHRGVDIAAPVGEAVRAATAGTVTFAGTAGDSGLTVAVRTADGRFDTSYLHLDALGVGEGERVEEGDEIGTAGVTGNRSVAAPHVHFGVRASGSDHAYRDPMRFLAEPGVPAPPLGPITAPRAGPRPLPGPSPARAPRLGPAPSLARVPRTAGSGAGAPVAAPALGPQPLALPARAPGAAVPTPRAAPEASSGGFDLGWALACAGLAIAAGALMRPHVPPRRRASVRAGGRSGTPVPAPAPTPTPVGRPAVR